MKKAAIILPSYNERENIKKLIPAIFLYTQNIANWDIHILVVDDTSPDGTADEVRRLIQKYPKNLHLLMGRKQGLGKAYRRGFAYSIDRLHADVVFEMDADGQHDPKILPQFFEKLDRGAEFVIGSRFIKGGSIPTNWGIDRKFFSVIGNMVLRLGFMKLSIHDWTSGYRAIQSDFIKATLGKYKGVDGYTFQIAILDQAIKHHLHIAEVPFNFLDRKNGDSKINTISYSFHNILYILNHSSFIKYCVVGFVGAAVDFGGSYVFIELLKQAIWLSTLISAEVSTLVNFMLNNYWSFSHKKFSQSGSFLRAISQFHVVQVGSILLQTLLMHYSTQFLGEKYWYLYKALIIGCVIIPYSYFMYNKFVWKDKKIEVLDEESST